MPTRILKVYIEPSTEFSNELCQIGLKTPCSLKVATLKLAPTVRTVGEAYIPKTGKEVKSLTLSASSSRVTWQSHPLNDILQQSIPHDYLL